MVTAPESLTDRVVEGWVQLPDGYRPLVAPGGDLYVTDGYGNARVHRFSAEGRLLQSWGEPGAGPGQFNLPHGIAVLADGRVLVADRENDRIQLFDPEGKYLDQWTQVQR